MKKFYIVTPNRVVYYKYEIEADSQQEAEEIFHKGEGVYIGYIDGLEALFDLDAWWEDDDWVKGRE